MTNLSVDGAEVLRLNCHVAHIAKVSQSDSMSSKHMQRALRSSTAVPRGPLILQTLEANRGALIAAAKASRPPIAAVSAILAEKFGTDVKERRVRQFIGLGVGAVLYDAGFEVSHTGVRVKGDPIFTTGSVYRLRVNDVDANAPEEGDVLERMMKLLTRDEAKRALRALKRYFPDLEEEGGDR